MRSSSYPPQYSGYKDPLGTPGGEPGDPGNFGSLLTPKTVVQLSVWLVMFGLGAGLSGLILFVIYQGQINDLRGELLDSQEELRKSLEERIQEAPATQESPSLNVSGQPVDEADPMKQLVDNAAPAIVGITGRDSSKAAVSGTGFVVNNTDNGAWVVTSYGLVAGIDEFGQASVRYDNSDLIGEVYEVDPARDLALVIFPLGTDRSLRFSRAKELKEGDQVWAVGHSRTKPNAVGIAAKLTSVSPTLLGLDVNIPEGYAGGPLLDEDGRVLGILTSRGGTVSTATPGAQGSGTATTIEQVCLRILRCPSRVRGTGASPSPSPSASRAPGSSPAAPAPAPEPPPPPPGEVVQPPISNPNTADVPIG